MRSGQRTQPAERNRPAAVPAEPGSGPGDGPAPQNQGYAVFGYLVSGMVVYGLLGWLVSWLTHWTPAIPIGALAGLVLAIVGVFYKYGRP
jgi:ATP synthase protein I